MTVKEAIKGITISERETFKIGFINADGREDETELDAYDNSDLELVYNNFCQENGFQLNTVIYVE